MCRNFDYIHMGLKNFLKNPTDEQVLQKRYLIQQGPIVVQKTIKKATRNGRQLTKLKENDNSQILKMNKKRKKVKYGVNPSMGVVRAQSGSIAKTGSKSQVRSAK